MKSVESVQNSSMHMKWEELNNHQFLWQHPLVQELLNEAIVYLALLAATEQFENQATDRLQLSALEEYEDSGTTQKADVKTTAKMLPSSLSYGLRNLLS